MSYLGDFRLGDTLDTKFTTRQISGAPFTLAGTPVISAYPGNGTTELTAGITLTADFDSRTGLNHVRVVASSGNGYATATNYQLVITTGTVNSVSVVGEVIGEFSIEARSAVMPTVAARTLDVSATGEAGVDWANVGAPTTTVGLTGTTISTAQVVASVTGAVGSVTGAVGSVTGNVGGNVTGSVGSVTGAVGSVTGNVGGNVTGSVGSIAANGITATSIATGAFTAAKFAAGAFDAVWTVTARILTAGTNIVLAKGTGVTGFNDLSSAQVTTACTASTPVAASVTGAVGSVTGNVGGNVTGSVGSVAANGITAASIATNAIDADALATDAVTELVNGVWNEPTSSHVTAGSTGKALADAAAAAGGSSPTTIAGAVWDKLRSAHVIAGSFGEGVSSVQGNVTGTVASVTGNVGGNVTGSVGSLGAQAKLDVNAEVVDTLNVDTYVEPSSPPAATASLAAKINWQQAIARNKINQTATTQAVRNDADSATIGTATVSDDGTTAVRGKFA